MRGYETIIMELEADAKALESLPTSRAKSIAITHLQTAILWLREAMKE